MTLARMLRLLPALICSTGVFLISSSAQSQAEDGFQPPSLPVSGDADNERTHQSYPRWIIALDPQTIEPEQEKPKEGIAARRMQVGQNLTFRIAQRCKEIIAETTSTLRIEFTRQEKEPVQEVDVYLRRVYSMEAMLLICLRLESSPNPANAGYRILLNHDLPYPLIRRESKAIPPPYRVCGNFSYL